MEMEKFLRKITLEIKTRGFKQSDIVTGYKLSPVAITNPEVNRYLKTLMNDCDIDKLLTFHVARHTFLTHLARTTGNLFKVMKYAGLRKTETAMVYVHLAGV
jgi:site-specific recombinase XerD